MYLQGLGCLSKFHIPIRNVKYPIGMDYTEGNQNTQNYPPERDIFREQGKLLTITTS